MQSYKSYFVSKYSVKQTPARNKKDRSRPQNTRTRRTSGSSLARGIRERIARLVKNLMIFLLPFSMLTISTFFYFNPVFTSPLENPGKASLLLETAPVENYTDALDDLPVNLDNSAVLPQDEDTEENRDTAIENSDDPNSFIDPGSIGDFVSINEDELDTFRLNPYKNTTEQISEVELSRKFTQYKVKSGDSIWQIARRNKLSLDTIISANNIKKVYDIHPGDNLRIPKLNGVYYRVRKYDTVASIAARFKIRESEIRKFNDIGTYLKLDQELFLHEARLSKSRRDLIFGGFFIRPVGGRITSRYGMRMHPIKKQRLFHTGLDIGDNNGNTIKAASSGYVVFAGKKGNYGNYVRIRHKLGYETCYGHLATIKVKKGQKVKQGHVIGTVGNTGGSTGPHLHFEIKHLNKFTNPLRFVKY